MTQFYPPAIALQVANMRPAMPGKHHPTMGDKHDPTINKR